MSPPAHLGHCHHIHGQYCARNDPDIKNIKLSKGPTATWEGRENNVKSYLEQLHPLTQTLECIFRAVLPDSWSKYVKVRDEMPRVLLEDEYHEALGIWRSRAIVIDSITNLDRDMKDIYYRWCPIVPLGDFSGGDV